MVDGEGQSRNSYVVLKSYGHLSKGIIQSSL